MQNNARSLLVNRSWTFQAEALGQTALQLVGNLCFALFVVGVLAFTIIAATYGPNDPLLPSSAFAPYTKLTAFLTSSTHATFRSDDTLLRTGEDFLNSTTSSSIASPDDPSAIDLADLPGSNSSSSPSSSSAADGAECDTDASEPIKCADPEVFHLMMRATIEAFRDVHFYRFGKPVSGGDGPGSCDMAWRFRPKNAKRAGFYKDYRRFEVARSGCSYSILKIGNYHTGINARKKKQQSKGGRDPAGGFVPENRPSQGLDPLVIPFIGEAVNDSLPVIESESRFSDGRYLIYSGGGDRCKSMNHFLWSFLCALGEAQYLNRTLVMDLTLCLSSKYSSTNQDEEGKDFRFYFDFQHLRDSASVLEQHQFWNDWNLWQKKDKLSLHLVEDFRITPVKLAKVQETLIMRKFGAVEPDNYWYRVCEGEMESVIQRPWHLIWKSRRLMDIVSGIASRLNWDYDSVHIVRGEKARNMKLWPNLATDTSPEALLSTLREKIEEGRHLYIDTNEPDTSFFDPLKDKYKTHFLDDYKDLWAENSEWHEETKNLNHGIPVEFDGYMRAEVDAEVFLRGKKQLETFNDLTSDCKHGINTCRTNS